MQRIVREQNRTLVMVTHDNHLAEYADRVFHISDGKIIRIEEKTEEISNTEKINETEEISETKKEKKSV